MTHVTKMELAVVALGGLSGLAAGAFLDTIAGYCAAITYKHIPNDALASVTGVFGSLLLVGAMSSLPVLVGKAVERRYRN